jgi:hypothetical protein
MATPKFDASEREHACGVRQRVSVFLQSVEFESELCRSETFNMSGAENSS